MAASQEQKVDFLLKKIGYTASKTGIAEDETGISGTKKAPFAEPIPSPLTLPGANIWSQSNQIPATPPGATTSIVRVYKTGSAQQLTFDSTVADNRSFVSRETPGEVTSTVVGDWVDTQFGSDYIVKVYKGDPNSGGVQLSAAGSGSNDTWFFDYSAGVLNFNGTNVPSGITTTNIYIEGYRYTGIKGITGVAQTFTDLEVSGIATFNGPVDMNSTLDVDGDTQLDDLNVSGVATFSNTVDLNAGLDIDGQLDVDELVVAGVATFSNTVDINSTLDVDGDTQLDDLTVAGVATFSSNINANGNIIGDDSTNISGINSVTATEYYGTGGTGSKLFVQDSQQNLLAGLRAGIAITTGENNAQQNVLLGRDVGRRMICGCDNVLIGNNVLKLTHRGRRNVILGHNAGSAFTTLAQVNTNVFIGRYTAASQQANVSNSIAIGMCAARCGTSNSSVLIGTQAGMGIQGQTHSNNIFLGSNAGASVSTGENNIAMGNAAGKCICCASNNIYLGVNAGKCDFRGCGNIALGSNAMCAGNVGQQVGGKPTCNVALGVNAGIAISSGDHNFLGGTNAGCSLISGGSNIAIGQNSLICQTTSNYSIALGYQAARSVSTGSGNMAFGFCALFCTTTGGCNHAFGNRALNQMTTGCFNIAMGGCVGRYMTSGCRNIFLGDQAACAFVSGDNNIAIGCRICVPLDTGSNQLAIGNRCCYWLTGDSSYNVGIGSTIPQARLDVFGGAKVDQLNVTGVSTFSSTITAATVNATGGNFSGNLRFANNVGTLFGASDELQVFHSSGTSYISHNGSGQLQIRAKSSEQGIKIFPDGAVELYYDNRLALQTQSGSVGIVGILTAKGVNAVGVVTASNLNISGVSTFGGDLSIADKIIHTGDTNTAIRFPANDKISLETAGAEALRVDDSGRLLIGSTSARTLFSGYIPHFQLEGTGAETHSQYSASIIANTSSVAGPTLYFAKSKGTTIGSNNAVQINDELGVIAFNGADGTDIQTIGGIIRAKADSNATSNNVDGRLEFLTSSNGTLAERLRISSDGNVTVNHDLIVSGVSTFTGDATFSGNVSVGGTLTYEDVSNIDSVGIITARKGVRITGGGLTVVGVSTFNDDIVGDTATNISGINTVAANFYYGCGGAGSRLFQNDSQGNLIAGTAAGLAITIGNSNQNNILIGKCAGNSINTSCFNVMIGQNAGLCLSGGSGQSTIIGRNAGAKLGAEGANPVGNTFLGFNAGANAISGNDNTFLGYQAGQGTIGCGNGGCNVAIGWRAGCLIKGGDNNIIMGRLSGVANSTGSNNTFIGNYSGRSNISGGSNIAIGAFAMRCNLSGGNNISLGKYAGKCGTTTSNNISIGQNAGCVGFGNDFNVAIGYQAGKSASGNAYFNTLIGANSGSNLTEGFNTFLGPSVGTAATAAKCNVAVGYQAGSNLTCGSCNVFVGQCAGAGWKTGQSNISIGARSGPLAGGNGTGFCNIIIGQCNADCITSGDTNQIIGAFAGKKLTTGGCNTLIGRIAGGGVTSGSDNVFIGGNNAGPQVEGFSGEFNLGITFGAMRSAIGNATGNVALGYYAGREICCASHNVMIGSRAGCCSKTGNRNVFIGCSAGLGNTTGHCNVYIGQQSGPQTCGATGCYNIAMGLRSGCSTTTGYKNIAIGFDAGICNTTNFSTITIGTNAGRCNVAQNLIAIGSGAGCKGASGSNHNTFIGNAAGAETTTGGFNNFFGQNAGRNNTEGAYNLYLGQAAGCTATTGDGNVALGRFAGPTTGDGTGDDNISIGKNSGNALSSGFRNILIGRCAGRITTTGTDNIFLGRDAGETNTEGKFNIAIGADVHLPSATGECQLAIGRNTNRWIQGDNSFNVCLAGAGVTATAAGTLCACRVAANKYLDDCKFNFIAGSCAGLGVTLSNLVCNNILIGKCAGSSIDTQCQIVAIGACAASCIADGVGQQVFVGQEAGRYLGRTGCGSYGNVYLGNQAGKNFVGGCSNVAIGYLAGRGIAGCVAGNQNINIGWQAGRDQKGSGNNISVGRNAGFALSSGSGNNIFMGNSVGTHAISANKNVALGYVAYHKDCTGGSNVILGNYTAACATALSNEIYIGSHAGRCGTGSYHNVGIGVNALRFITTGKRNVAIGRCSGLYITTGSGNIFFGSNSGFNNTCGKYNLFFGNSAGSSNTTGNYNIFLGLAAGTANTISSHSIAIGSYAGRCGKNSHGIAIGCRSSHHACRNDSSDNIAIGRRAYEGVSGKMDGISCRNVAVGTYAGFYHTAGKTNITLGFDAGKHNRGGDDNIAIGRGTNCTLCVGKQNISMGVNAGRCIANGCYNVFLGQYAGRDINNGSTNIAIGRRAGMSITDSNLNILIGCCAGSDTTSGSRNIAIGCNVQLPSATGSAQLAIGDATNRWITGDSSFKVTLAGIVTATAGGAVCANSTTLKAYALDTDIFSIIRSDHASSKLFRIFQDSSSGGGAGGAHINTFNRQLMITASASAATDSGIYLKTTGEVGIGTDNPTSKLHVIGDTKVSGMLTASRYDGDSDCNIIMGHRAGIAITPASTDVCGTVVIGRCAAQRLRCGGNRAVFIGDNAGEHMNCSEGSVFIGQCAGCSAICGQDNVLIGRAAGARTAPKDRNTIGQGFNRNVIIGNYSGRFTHSCCNVMIGAMAGMCVNGGQNVILGTCAAGGSGISTSAGAAFNVIIGAFAGSNMKGGSENILLGRGVGSSMSTGSSNIMMGCATGACLLTSGGNIFLGTYAGQKGTTSGSNIFIGGRAGQCVTTGTNNIAIGGRAGCCLGSSTYSVYIGNEAGRCATSNNVVIGNSAGKCVSQSHNTFIGDHAGTKATEACGNTFLGKYAGACTTTGNRNTNIGCQAGVGNTTGGHNINIGASSGPATCGATGESNVFMGRYAGKNTSTASCNIVIGRAAGCCLTTGCRNIFFGRFAGVGMTTGCSNFFAGNQAGPATCGHTGSHNIAFMDNSMRCSTGSASCNIAIGLDAGKCVTGDENVFIGKNAGGYASPVTSGSRNIAIGKDVDISSATGNDQLEIGCNNMRWISGDSSFNVTLAGIVTATAAGAVCATTYHGDGSNLTGISAGVGTANVSTIGLVVAGLSTFHNNVELLSMDDGSSAAPEFILNRHSASPADADYLGNIKFQGKQDGGGTVNYAKISGKILDASNGTEDGILEFMIRKNGSNNIAARFRSDSLQLLNDTAFSVAGDITANGNIAGDSSTNITGIADITASGTVQAGNFDSTSDVRLKTNIQPIDDPIAKVIQIEGVSFNWKKDNRPALGVIADQVQEILPELVHGDDPKTVNYNGLVGLLIEVVKDQQKQIDSLNDRISKLE